MVEEEWKRQFAADNLYFKNLIDMVPAHFYFDQSTKQRLRGEVSEESGDEDGEESSSGKTEGNKQKAQKRSQPEMSDKASWKRKKFDPAQIKSVTDLQEELIAAENKEKEKLKSSKKSHTSDDLFTFNAESDLKEKLHQKIIILQAKRKSIEKGQILQRKKLKRRESKMKLKMRRQNEKQNKVKGQHDKTGGMQAKAKSPASKPIYNKDGKLVFSKFDFRDSGEKSKDSTGGGKNYGKMLEKIQKQKEKVNKLQETDKDAAKHFEEKTQWKTVLQKAEGVRVKDNAALIKKSMKRKEKLKEKSKKEWQERDRKLKEQMQEKKDKRQSNIQKKKKMRVDKKITKGKKKGHILPGF